MAARLLLLRNSSLLFSHRVRRHSLSSIASRSHYLEFLPSTTEPLSLDRFILSFHSVRDLSPASIRARRSSMIRENHSNTSDAHRVDSQRGLHRPLAFSLKGFLAASMIPCYCWCCLAVTLPIPVDGWVVPGTVRRLRTVNRSDGFGGGSRPSITENGVGLGWTASTTRSVPFSRKFPAIRCFSSSSHSGPEGGSTELGGEKDDFFATTYHAPVMVHECLDALLECRDGKMRNPKPKKGSRKKKHRNKKAKQAAAEEEATANAVLDHAAVDLPPLVFVDGTLGGGGHSNALLQRLRPGDVLLGCDVDPKALETASERLSHYIHHPGTDRPLFVPVATNFGDLAESLPRVVHPETGEPILEASGGVDGILLDLGVSSHQIDEAERGFSFMRDGPLDMRMGRAIVPEQQDPGHESSPITVATGLTAADVCNEFDERELQRILSVYGDEPRAKTIAGAIVRHRPLHTTGELAEAIASVTAQFAKNKRHGRTATCARVFQSLRIVVNNEETVLGRVLSEACPLLLKPGGRLVVMSYHSMEDRATKRIMRDGSLDGKPRRGGRNPETDLYGNYIGPPKPFKPVQKRRKATDEEIERNPRARSAVLRVAERQDN